MIIIHNHHKSSWNIINYPVHSETWHSMIWESEPGEIDKQLTDWSDEEEDLGDLNFTIFPEDSKFWSNPLSAILKSVKILV